MITEQKELRREADQHDRNASIILSTAPVPSYEDAERAAIEMERAKDKRALADLSDLPTRTIFYPYPRVL
jgi:hypothetical protein